MGFTTLFQKEKNDGNQELTYAEEQNNQSIEDETSGEVTFVTEKEDPLEQKEDRTKQEGAEETVIEEKETYYIIEIL